MLRRESSLGGDPPVKRVHGASGVDRRALIPIIVGFLTAASVLLLIYHENRAVQYRFEATEVWSAYQVKIVKAAIEEDPNLKAQYAEEQDVLRQHAQDLTEKSSDARQAVMISAVAVLLLLLGGATAVFALFANSIHAVYACVLLGVIGVGLGVRALF